MSFFNHLLPFVWSEFVKAYSIRFLPIDIHGIGVMIGRLLEGGGKALLLGLPVAIGEVKLGGIVDPSIKGERSGDDAPASVKEGAVKAILVELDKRGVSYYSSFCSEGFEFHHVFIASLRFLF